MPDFAVKTAFTAWDRISPVFNKMGNSADKFGGKATSAFGRASAAASRFATRAKQFVSLGLGAGALMIGKEFIDFDQAIISASAKFPDLNRNTKEGQKTLEQLGVTARKVGADTQFSSSDAAKGLNFLAMAGFNAQQSMALLPGVVDLATVGEMDLSRASDIASDAIGAFGLMTSNTTDLSKNFIRVQDVMAKTITSTNTNMEDLFESIKFGAAPFTAAGQSMETFSAIAGRMAANGIKGSMAGTALRSAILRLQKPTSEIMGGLDAFGLTVSDLADPSTGKLKDMVVIMKMMETGGKKLTTIERNAALTMIMGKNAVSGWASVMNEGVGVTEELKKSLDGAAGTSQNMAAIMRTSLLNQLKTLLSTIIEIGFKFIDGFKGQGADAIGTLIDVARGLGPVFEFAGAAISQILSLMPFLVTWFLVYKAAVWGSIVAQKAYAAMEFVQVLMATAKAQGILNAVMLMNPVGLLIIGIGLLIAAIWLVVDGWDTWGSALSLLFGPIGMIINMVKSVYDNWQAIKDAFNDGGILSGLMAIGKAILSGLLAPIEQLLDLLSALPGVGKYAAAGMAKIKGFREELFAPPEEVKNVRSNIFSPDKFIIPQNQGKILETAEKQEKSNIFNPKNFMMPQPMQDIKKTSNVNNIKNENKYQAPNENLLRAQQVRLNGEINFNNAPAGTTAKSKTTGSQSLIKMNMVGANP